ncbi:phosphotransferase [Candidatus Bathyarchaeota archaeon]|nr:phosphotransferase [Candidatus Bathyarchaeota archaeon]
MRMEWVNADMERVMIGNESVRWRKFMQLLEPALPNQVSNIRREEIDIVGPFDGKINTIYRIKAAHSNKIPNLIFRARISSAFRYENVVKEKILFPILNGKLKLQDNDNLNQDIKNITNKKEGSYIFPADAPPIIPVQDLYYYNETRQQIPYMYSILSYARGISLHDFIEKNGVNGANANDLDPKSREIVEHAFNEAGRFLGRLHEIEFPGFHESILDIGDESRMVDWKELFFSRVDDLLDEASRHALMEPIISRLRAYFREYESLIPDEETAVLFHNDYQPQNFIMDPSTGSINAVIDFDNWQIGPREQDFIKIQYWGLRDLDPAFSRKFLEGYGEFHDMGGDFQKKVDLYKMQWFILVFNIEMDKILKREKNATVDSRFPSAGQYIEEITKILDQTS